MNRYKTGDPVPEINPIWYIILFVSLFIIVWCVATLSQYEGG